MCFYSLLEIFSNIKSQTRQITQSVQQNQQTLSKSIIPELVGIGVCLVSYVIFHSLDADEFLRLLVAHIQTTHTAAALNLFNLDITCHLITQHQFVLNIDRNLSTQNIFNCSPTKMQYVTYCLISLKMVTSVLVEYFLTQYPMHQKSICIYFHVILTSYSL